MGEGYDVVVVGELHGNADIRRKEYELVLQERPEYLLLEGLDQYDAEDLAPLLERADAFETAASADNFLTEQYGTGIDVSAPADQPVYDMAKEDLDAVVAEIDEHRSEADGAYEQTLGELQAFYEEVGIWKRSPFRQQRPVWTSLLDLQKYGYETGIAGCDVDKRPTIEDLLTAAGREEREFILEREVLDRWAEREREMADRITTYVDRAETDRPVVAVVGALHIWDENDIIPRLEENGITPRIEQFGPSNNVEMMESAQDSAAYTDYILSEQGARDMLAHREYLDALEPL